MNHILGSIDIDMLLVATVTVSDIEVKVGVITDNKKQVSFFNTIFTNLNI